MTVPILTDHFSALAGNYDAVLSDVWGVVHNGVAATPHRRISRATSHRASQPFDPNLRVHRPFLHTGRRI